MIVKGKWTMLVWQGVGHSVGQWNQRSRRAFREAKRKSSQSRKADAELHPRCIETVLPMPTL
ncbi:hypothetical protein LY76DRAFT_236444 [Colletotrichum caudatum]|nr:hypothetical protein LY76DRAFT_236444 [Colletotrichum caudatum]